MYIYNSFVYCIIYELSSAFYEMNTINFGSHFNIASYKRMWHTCTLYRVGHNRMLNVARRYIKDIMEHMCWFAFVVLQMLSSMDAFSEEKCPDDFHFNYESKSDNDSSIFEDEIWVPECVRIRDFQENTVDLPKIINASALPDCFNMTIDISTVQSLSSENRYKFENVRSENPTAENLTTCFPVLKYLQNCLQMSWFPLHERYHLTEQLTLEDKMNGRNYSLGYYFITTAGKLRDYNLTEFEILGHMGNQTIVAITCDEDLVPAEKPYCQSFQFLPEDFQLQADNSIIFPNIDEQLWFPSYKNNTDDGTIDLCYPLSNYLQNCVNLHTVDRIKMTDNVDRVLYRIYIPSLPYKRIFDLGNYYFDESCQNVTVCLDNSFINRNKFWCFTGLFIVSAICIFLTILLQNCMALQSTKQNSKPLFNCLLSMMFRYIFFAIRNFSFQVELIVYRYVIFAMCLYFGLATFLWLSVLSFDMWHNFSDLNDRIGQRSCFRCKHCNNQKKSILIVYHTYAWGIPIIFVGFALFLELQVEYQKEFGLYLDLYPRMWFTTVKGISTGLVFFHGPIGLIIVANMIFFLLTVVNLQGISKGTSAANKEINRQMLIVCIKLFVIMGLIWTFEVIGYVIPPNPLNAMAFFVFDVLNASTGILIFLLYACRRQTLQVLGRICNRNATNDLELSKISSLSADNS